MSVRTGAPNSLITLAVTNGCSTTPSMTMFLPNRRLPRARMLSKSWILTLVGKERPGFLAMNRVPPVCSASTLTSEYTAPADGSTNQPSLSGT